MKVYIVTREPFPNGMAGTNRIKCYAKAIQEQGIPCEVIIFVRSEVYGKSPKNTMREGIIEGISYKYIGAVPLRHKNIFVRKINDVLDKIKTMSYLSKHLQKDDIVFSYCGVYVRYINMIINLTHKRKAIFVRDLCELPYGTSKETKKKIKLRKYTLEKQFPKCDGFVAISETLAEIAVQYKNPCAQVLKVPILVDFEKYSMPDRSKEAEIPYIFHSGTLLEQKDGILGMIEAFGKALHKLPFPIRFVSTGKKEKSPHYKAIDSIIEKYHLEDSVIFTGYLSEDDLRKYLSEASLVIINKYNTQQNKYCFSTKLGEYLAASKPVIITNVGEAMHWLTDNIDSYVVDAENVDALSDRIVDAFADEEKRYYIAHNGNELCKTCFNYRCYGGIFKDFFYKLSSNTD